MYKVLIVDDEPLAREYVRKIVDWDKLSLDVCAEATDGEDALMKIKACQPDIILLDMIMPLMDGLALAEFIKEHHIKTYIIIITGSDEIEYVRKSMKLDVRDYLLKPFDVEELEHALVQAKKQIQKDDMSTMRHKKSMIYNLLFNPVDENIAIAKEYFDLDKKMYFQISVMYCSKEQGRQRLIKRLRSHFSMDNSILFIKNGISQIICFYELGDKKNKTELMNRFQCFFDKYGTPLEQPLVGIGHVCDTILEIGNSYKQALEMVNNGIIFGEKGVKLYKTNPSDIAKYFYSITDLEQLLVALRSGDQQKVMMQLDNIFEHLEKEKVDYEHLITISNGLMSICYSTITENTSGRYADGDSMHYNFRHKKISEIKEHVIQFYVESIKQNKTVKRTKAQKVAEDSVDFIKDNYADPALSIRMIGEALHLDISYVRRVFKKVMGKTMNNYIIDLRMQKSKELLMKNEYKHSEIASMVGYIDAAYFSKSFKKYVGITPKEFEISSQYRSE